MASNWKLVNVCACCSVHTAHVCGGICHLSLLQSSNRHRQPCSMFTSGDVGSRFARTWKRWSVNDDEEEESQYHEDKGHKTHVEEEIHEESFEHEKASLVEMENKIENENPHISDVTGFNEG